jgi:hypothetical protein
MDAFDDAIALDEVHAFKGNVEAGIFGVAKEHEFAASAFGFDEAEAFKLADAVIDVNDEVTRLEFGEITKKAGGADFAAGTLDSGGDVEKVGVAVESDLGLGKGDASGKGSAQENEGGGFGCVFGGETGGGFLGFAKDVGDFVFAADIREALKFTEAGGCEISSAAAGELGFDVAETGDDITVEASGGARGEFKARAAVGDETELLEFDARGFEDGAIEFGFAPEIVGDFGSVGLAMALVIFGGGFEMLAGGFAKIDGLVEKDEGLEGTFGEFKERGCADFPAATDPAGGLPVESFLAAGGGDAPFGERENGGFDDGSDGALGAGIKFANALNGVAEKFKTNGTGRFGRKDVDDATANGELAGEIDHFGAGVTGAGEVGDEFFVGNFRVFGESAREGEVDIRILVAPESGGKRGDDERDFAVGETVESGGAAFEDVRVSRLRIPRKAIESGEDGDAACVAGEYLEEETETVSERLSAAIGIGDEEGWAAEFVGEVGGDECFGNVLQTGKRDKVGVGT